MFIPDMPNVPPHNVPVMIAQANQDQPSNATTTRSLGICHPVPNEGGMLSPIGMAHDYFYLYEHQKKVSGPATATILQQPKHGILRLVTEADRGTLFNSSSGSVDPAKGLYAYLPESGYLGKDSATILVEIGGIQVKVVYFFQALGPGANLGNYGLEELCSTTGVAWKISLTSGSIRPMVQIGQTGLTRRSTRTR